MQREQDLKAAICIDRMKLPLRRLHNEGTSPSPAPLPLAKCSFCWDMPWAEHFNWRALLRRTVAFSFSGLTPGCGCKLLYLHDAPSRGQLQKVHNVRRQKNLVLWHALRF